MQLPALWRKAEARLATVAPVPEWAVTQVLLSGDLLPPIMASMRVNDVAAAMVCKAWHRSWQDTSELRRGLHRAPWPQPDTSDTFYGFMTLPGEQLCVLQHDGEDSDEIHALASAGMRIASPRCGAIEPSYRSWKGHMYSRFWVQDSDEILAPA